MRDEKLNENILIYLTRYVTSNSLKTLYLIIKRRNGYRQEHNEDKYLTLAHADKSKYIFKK